MDKVQKQDSLKNILVVGIYTALYVAADKSVVNNNRFIYVAGLCFLLNNFTICINFWCVEFEEKYQLFLCVCTLQEITLTIFTWNVVLKILTKTLAITDL
jgi:hypothetical protein